MTRRIVVALLLPLLAVLAFASCSEDETPSGSERSKLAPIVFDNAMVHAELAISRQEQQRGLMYRDQLPEDRGMLFIYRQPSRMSFWMRNTRIPLDIGFFTEDGVLREVYPLYPYDESSVKSRRSDLVYALEVNQGWFAEHGIKPGNAFDVEKLEAFLEKK